MQKFLRIPVDVWFALSVCVGILLIRRDVLPIIIAIYVMVCAYIVMKTFTED